MNWFNVLMAGFEVKKQYIIISVIVVILSSIGGYYAITNNDSTPNETKEITISVDTVKQESLTDKSKASAFREGEFKESKKESF